LCHGTGEGGVADPMLLIPVSTKFSGVESPLKKGQCCIMIWV
jgi:cyclin A